MMIMMTMMMPITRASAKSRAPGALRFSHYLLLLLVSMHRSRVSQRSALSLSKREPAPGIPDVEAGADQTTHLKSPLGRAPSPAAVPPAPEKTRVSSPFRMPRRERGYPLADNYQRKDRFSLDAKRERERERERKHHPSRRSLAPKGARDDESPAQTRAR